MLQHLDQLGHPPLALCLQLGGSSVQFKPPLPPLLTVEGLHRELSSSVRESAGADHLAGRQVIVSLSVCGVILSVGGLGYLGLLAVASDVMYQQWGATSANVVVGLSSSVLENIPTMSAVLEMNPEMSTGQWLLVTLAAGVGGSLLSIGSAAGIALMGQSNGQYTFFSHLRWTPLICLGYAISILLHIWINAALF